ncbi:unnamed protein product [Allacma fusca]|uniref:Venom dipeptidyl peptidase 4 n=1 Tax=Allacma fusca TaxID=39272 RepID=A0A8J2NX87_9HEXA|nr:unnamed protein product [Allacma fusca]
MTEFEAPDEELVAATPSQRNWKGILIALLVICAVCGLILFSIYLLRPPDDGPRVKGRKITLSDIISSRFSNHAFNGSWISDNELLFRDYLGGLSLLNVETLVSRPFLANTTFRQLNAQIYSVSPDRRFILFVHDERPLWTYSYVAKYTVYDIQNEFPVLLSSSESREEEQPDLQYAVWSPRGSALIFVFENDIYLKPDPKSAQVIRITNTGIPGVIFNGVPDFIYEEEILKSKSALWPSPNGQRLLYGSFNDSRVGEAVFSWYADAKPYPNLKTLRYPKTGTANPEVSLWVADISEEQVEASQVTLPPFMVTNEYYFSSASWFNDDTVVVNWMNRKQTVAVVTWCRSPTWKCQEVHTVKLQGVGWLDFIDIPIFSANGSSYLVRVPWRDGEVGQFQHVVWIDGVTRKEIPVTHGPYEVTRILAWDQPLHQIYFIGVPNGSPGERHLFRVSEKGSNSSDTPTPVCLTCPPAVPTEKGKDFEEIEDPDESSVLLLSSSPAPTDSDVGNQSASENVLPPTRQPTCLYNNVIFSPNNKFYVRECLGPGVPIMTLHSAPSGRLLLILNNNSVLQEEVANMGMPLVRNLRVALSGGYHAPVRLYLPPGLRAEEEFKFPLVLHVDGSPGSQQVSEKFRLSWATYLTSQKNFIVAEVDGRGTGFQGESLRHAVARNLGNVEVRDHLEIMEFLKVNLTYVDTDNMMVWGRNYGGYLAALIMAQDSGNLFRCGIFVTPITRWEFYNTVYTERYMGMPNYSDNYRGYEQSDLTRKEIVDKLREKKFLLIHGTADNSVHFQHTLHFSKQLINKGITFKEQIYPDEDNDLRGVAEHMYGTMESFIDSSFDFMDFDDWEKANFLGRKT